MFTLITNGACFDVRRVSQNDVTYMNKATGQSYRVQAIADTWSENGYRYTDVMVLVNGKVVFTAFDERITNRASRYTRRYLFTSESQVYPVAMDIGERYVKRQEAIV